MITNKHAEDFIQALDESRFYDAHEVLEELWFDNRKNPTNEVNLLRGFINAAVSFELNKRGKTEASKRVWRNYLKYRQLVFKTGSNKVKIYYNISLYIDNLYKKTQLF
ncbi:DUF309 domain-containing protein [Sulfurimonas sp.]|uniref:DUF309 domain-containing protein n=1 Tax=Sulfurimonas sp. TaxID=2022749 RepID=UPI00356A8C96